ncbi:hypothetical protein WJX73_006736 [Symbiochloris irregularis]|uniref:PDZ domain-containing protein n=1 Tax=Symbiochloris irregularis TaxID=706552 RepID=A0AAW1PBL6_9CHLO
MNPPCVNVIVDVKRLIKDPVKTLLPILSEIPGWELASEQSIEAKQLCGAMTNIIYKCTLKVTDEPVLVRIFGGDEGLFSREDEIRIFAAVAHAGLGPQLRASFLNGRVEEFLLDGNLSANQMKTPKVCACVGAAVACFHFTSLPRLPVEKTRNPVPIVWPRIRAWGKIVHQLCSQAELEKYQLVNVQEEINKLERDLKEGHPTWLGFCHNDLQYGNMLLHTATPLSLNEDKVRSAASYEAAIAAESVADDFDDAQSLSGFSVDGGSPRARSPARGSSLEPRAGSSLEPALSDEVEAEREDTVFDLKSKNRLSIRLIDYEYAGYNPVAYDMANHWCEYAADYHTDTPHKLDYRRLPDKTMQLVFVRAYVNAVLALQQHAHPENLTRHDGRPAASDIVSRDMARTLRLRHSFGRSIDHHFHYPRQLSPEPSLEPPDPPGEVSDAPHGAQHDSAPSMRLKPDECVLAAAVTVSAVERCAGWHHGTFDPCRRHRRHGAQNCRGRAEACDQSTADAQPAAFERRSLLAAALCTQILEVQQQHPAAAYALQDVTPAVAPASPLTAREQAIIDIFERVAPAVVNVFDIGLQGGGRSLSVDAPEGNGTGFIWDSEGHVVTNYHVLATTLTRLPAKLQLQGRPSADASKPPGPKVARVAVLGADGFSDSYDGFLVGSDRSKDLAVLKLFLPEGKARPVQLGESSGLRIGQQCLAVGNPFGFDHSLSTGVISGLNREIASPAGPVITGGIQSDAAINPGNSGGPMLDSSGRVVGVNTAIFTNTGASAGIGFAIPIDAVRRVVPQLIQYGHVVRPALNVQVASDQVAQALKVRRGAMIQSVPSNSAAAKAGLLPTRRGLTGVVAGDVIIGVNDMPINSGRELSGVLEGFQLGEQVALQVLRGNDKVKISLRLEEEGAA